MFYLLKFIFFSSQNKSMRTSLSCDLQNQVIAFKYLFTTEKLQCNPDKNSFKKLCFFNNNINYPMSMSHYLVGIH